MRFLLGRNPSPQIIISFSVNAPDAARLFEKGCPSPRARLQEARRLVDRGWRVRIRLDPVVYEIGLDKYRDVCFLIRDLHPERVTVGTLRQYPGLHFFAPQAPRRGLTRAGDGRLRYAPAVRTQTYTQLAEWLGFQPALCKETVELWEALGWEFSGCNCTP